MEKWEPTEEQKAIWRREREIILQEEEEQRRRRRRSGERLSWFSLAFSVLALLINVSVMILSKLVH